MENSVSYATLKKNIQNLKKLKSWAKQLINEIDEYISNQKVVQNIESKYFV